MLCAAAIAMQIPAANSPIAAAVDLCGCSCLYLPLYCRQVPWHHSCGSCC